MKVFCSYSHRDRDLKGELEEHLSVLVISGKISIFWSDDLITAGTEFDPTIRRELDEADVVLMLLTASYFKSAYCWNVEARRALRHHESGQTRVVPILMRDVTWQETPIKKYSVVPRNLVAVTSWQNRDEAFTEITKEITRVIDELAASPQVAGNTLRVSGIEHSEAALRCILAIDCPTALRCTGLTELLPDLVLRFEGDLGNRRIADIRLIVNTVVTSRLGGGGLTEATLSLATKQVTSRLPTLSRGIRGIYVAANSVAFLHVPLHELALLDTAERNLRIANVRVNAAMLVHALRAEVVIAVTVSDISVEPSSSTIATVEGNFEFGVSDGERERLLRGGQDLNSELLGPDKHAHGVTAILRFTGVLGSYEPAGERTRLLVRFWMVPSGISLFVTTEQIASSPSALSATLVQADLTGSGPSQAKDVDGYSEFNDRSFALSRLDLHSGTAYAVWELEGISTTTVQNVELGVIIAYESKPESYVPTRGAILVSGDLAPRSSNHTASASAPVPRFGRDSLPIELCIITD